MCKQDTLHNPWTKLTGTDEQSLAQQTGSVDSFVSLVNAISLQYAGRRETMYRLVELRVLSLVKLLCGRNHFLSSLWPTANDNGTQRAAAPADWLLTDKNHYLKTLMGVPNGTVVFLSKKIWYIIYRGRSKALKTASTTIFVSHVRPVRRKKKKR